MVRRIAIINLCNKFFHVKSKRANLEYLKSSTRKISVHRLVIKRRKGRNESNFKTHCTCNQITGQDPPGPLATAYVFDSGDLINNQPQLATSFNYFFRQIGGHAKRPRPTKPPILAVGCIGPAPQEPVPFSFDGN